MWQRGTTVRVLSYCSYLVQLSTGIKHIHANDIRPISTNVLKAGANYAEHSNYVLTDKGNTEAAKQSIGREKTNPMNTIPTKNIVNTTTGVNQNIIPCDENEKDILPIDNVPHGRKKEIFSSNDNITCEYVSSPQEDRTKSFVATRSGRIVKPPSKLDL